MPEGETTIFFVGHSLIEFFDWQGRFPTFKVHNLGLAGETVEGLLGRTEKIIRDMPRPDFLFLMTGINNVAMDDMDFMEAYKEIVRKFRTAYPGTIIVVQSMLYVMLEWVQPFTVRIANKTIEELALKNGAEYLDLNPLFEDENGNPRPEFYLEDGVHLSHEGYSVWCKRLEEFIEARLDGTSLAAHVQEL